MDPEITKAIGAGIALVVVYAVRSILGEIREWLDRRDWARRQTLKECLIAAVDEVERTCARPRREAVEARYVAEERASRGEIKPEEVPRTSDIGAAEKAVWNEKATERTFEIAADRGLDIGKVLGSAARAIVPGLISVVATVAKGDGFSTLLDSAIDSLSARER